MPLPFPQHPASATDLSEYCIVKSAKSSGHPHGLIVTCTLLWGMVSDSASTLKAVTSVTVSVGRPSVPPYTLAKTGMSRPMCTPALFGDRVIRSDQVRHSRNSWFTPSSASSPPRAPSVRPRPPSLTSPLGGTRLVTRSQNTSPTSAPSPENLQKGCLTHLARQGQEAECSRRIFLVFLACCKRVAKRRLLVEGRSRGGDG